MKDWEVRLSRTESLVRLRLRELIRLWDEFARSRTERRASEDWERFRSWRRTSSSSDSRIEVRVEYMLEAAMLWVRLRSLENWTERSWDCWGSPLITETRCLLTTEARTTAFSEGCHSESIIESGSVGDGSDHS